MSTVADPPNTAPAPVPTPPTASSEAPSGSSPGFPSTSSNTNIGAVPISSSSTTTSPSVSSPPASVVPSSSSRLATQPSSSSAAPAQTPTGTSTTTSQLSPRTPTTTNTTSTAAGGGPSSSTSTAPPLNLINPNLPSQSAQVHIAEARAALVGSMSNLLDSELQSRAALLHQNAAALGKQEQDVARATEALRRENDKLAKVAREAGKRIKETGNVQNWAEVLERDFLVLEETLRRVREGSTGSEGGSGSGTGSWWSGSEGSVDGDAAAGAAGEGDDSVEKKVEDVVSGDADTAGAMDVDTNAVEPGEHEGTFASVDSAIERDIREAMATSLDDRELPPPAIELEGEVRDISKEEDLANGDVMDSHPVDLSAMDVDVEAETGGKDKGKHVAHGSVLDILAFADTGLSPGTMKEAEAPTQPTEEDIVAAPTETDMEVDAAPEAKVMEAHRANVLDVIAFADTGINPEEIDAAEVPTASSGTDIAAVVEPEANVRGDTEEAVHHDKMDVDEPEVIDTPQAENRGSETQMAHEQSDGGLVNASAEPTAAA